MLMNVQVGDIYIRLSVVRYVVFKVMGTYS